MKNLLPLGRRFIVVAAFLLIQTGSAFGQDKVGSRPPPGSSSVHRFDWLEHTRHTLAELESKLNLAPAQHAPWDEWSAGVLQDAHTQLNAHRDGGGGGRTEPVAYSEEQTTPQQMATGIAHLRIEINAMQSHLAELEAAQIRTQAFYDKLDTNQKTIFDLFWHEMYHRSAGHDEGWGIDDHEEFAPGTNRGER
jgi:hypothetical protein